VAFWDVCCDPAAASKSQSKQKNKRSTEFIIEIEIVVVIHRVVIVALHRQTDVDEEDDLHSTSPSYTLPVFAVFPKKSQMRQIGRCISLPVLRRSPSNNNHSSNNSHIQYPPQVPSKMLSYAPLSAMPLNSAFSVLSMPLPTSSNNSVVSMPSPQRKVFGESLRLPPWQRLKQRSHTGHCNTSGIPEHRR
jgi:hypothetical protein